MRALVLSLLMLTLGGCGVATASGKCKDYKPADPCRAGERYACVTTDDGCEQCRCESIAPVRERLEYGPQPPGPW